MARPRLAYANVVAQPLTFEECAALPLLCVILQGEAKLCELERGGELGDLLIVGRVLQGQHAKLEAQITALRSGRDITA